MMKLAFCNQSTLLTDAQADLIARACINQINWHAAPIWCGTVAQNPVVQGGFFPKNSPPAGFDVITFFDDADQAGALGYHTEGTDGSVTGKVFIKTTLSQPGTSILTGAGSVCTVASHEALELWQDRNVDKWALAPDGNLYAWEIGDPVENDWYPTKSLYGGQNLSLSNFVLPPFFDDSPAKGAKFDFLGKLSAPFTMSPGGYMVYASFDPNSQQQKFGSLSNAHVIQKSGGLILVAHFGSEFPEWKKASKLHELSRATRRMARKLG